MHIAMWSGPRNLSTAMMYAFGARADCVVWDEPFYAAYLVATGLTHPMQAEILAAGEADPKKVSEQCIASAPEGEAVFYQKHMCHHMLPDFPHAWMQNMANVFLIRSPASVVASYQAKRENPSLEDIGFKQQAALFGQLVAAGQSPVVIDSDDILAHPEAALKALCKAIGLGFDPQMLSWPTGGHKEDGAWAPHWYGSVWKSTGFVAKKPKPPMLTLDGKKLAALAQPYFEQLSEGKLVIT